MGINFLKRKRKGHERAIPDDSVLAVALTTSLHDLNGKKSYTVRGSFIRLRPVSECFTNNKVTKLSPSSDSIVFGKLAHLKKSALTLKFHHLFEAPMSPKNKNIKYEDPIKVEEPVSIVENIRDTLALLKERVKGYVITITERDVEVPYQLTSEMFERAEATTIDCKTDEEKAKVLFDWLESEIEYGSSKRGLVGYRNSKEVFERKEGVCGEMAYTYITIARSLGLKAGYVSVAVDAYGSRVHHGCAYVSLNGCDVLVDIAYHTFDISHQEYSKLSDREAIRQFKSWR